MSDKPKTADQLAAEAAEAMFKSGGRSAKTGQPIIQQHAEQAPEPLEKGGGAGAMPTTTGAATGGFTGTAGGKVLDKSDDDDEDDKKDKKDKDEDEDEDEMEKKKDCKKSEEPPITVTDDPAPVDADALSKSMDALDAAADGIEEPEIDRRAELAKALEEGTLDDDDRAELMGLLGGDAPAPASDAINKGGWGDDEPTEEPAEEPIDKGFEQVLGEEFSDDYDVSPFLEKFGNAVGAGMDIMREDLAKSGGDQRTFNKALSKSFRGVAQIIQGQGDMIKSLAGQNTALAQRLGIVEQQPVGRKSAANKAQAVPLQKSFADQSPDDIGMDRDGIFKGLHLLMQKYKDTGGRAKNGEPIDRAMTAFELSGNISKSLLSECKDALGGQ